MSAKDREIPLELEPKAKKGKRDSDSSKAAIRAFRKGSAIGSYHGRLSKPGYVAACHSRKPEALVKVVKDPPRGKRVRALLEYIARTNAPSQDGLPGAVHEPVWLVDHKGRVFNTPEDIEVLAKSWVESFNPDILKTRQLRAEKSAMLLEMELSSASRKAELEQLLARTDSKLRKIAQKPSLIAQEKAGRARRDVAHLVLSAKAENTGTNQQRTLTAAEKAAAQFFPNHEYVIGLHQDGKFPHVHIVVKSQSKQMQLSEEKGHGKLRLNKPELLQLRTLWAKELTAVGLEHVATLREDRPHVMRDVAAGKAPLKSKNLNWYAASIEGLAAGQKFLEKRQADLDKALKQSQGHKEAAEIRKQIGLSLNELRSQIRDKTKQGDKARQAAFNALLRIERDLNRKIDPQLRLKELAETSGQHRPVYKMILEAVEHAPRTHTAQKQSLGLDYEAQAALAAAQERIATAWRELKKGGLTQDEFKIAAQVLSFHEKEVNKAFGLDVGADKGSQKPRKDFTRETRKNRESRPNKKTHEFER